MIWCPHGSVRQHNDRVRSTVIAITITERHCYWAGPLKARRSSLDAYYADSKGGLMNGLVILNH